jgi:hypothetical protein
MAEAPKRYGIYRAMLLEMRLAISGDFRRALPKFGLANLKINIW